MKKLFKGFLSAFLVGAMVVGATACATVKNGSVIKNCKVTFSYFVNGVEKEQEVNFELYENFAPLTIEHFTYLANQGYYDNTVVSNVSGYLEFGGYFADGNELKSKYESGLKNGYYDVITDSYASGKKLGDTPFYTADKSVFGEFSANGVSGNKLDFSAGALVVKRDYSENSKKSYFNTGKATMAVTFGTGSYFADKNKFAILGKLSQDDELSVTDTEGNAKTMSSYSFVYMLFSDYKSEKIDDDTTYSYHYFTYDYSEYPYEEGDEEYNAEDAEDYAKINAKLQEYGRYFRRSGSDYFYKDAEGNYTIELDSDDEDDALLIDAFSSKSLYFLTVPYNTITVKSVKVEK